MKIDSGIGDKMSQSAVYAACPFVVLAPNR